MVLCIKIYDQTFKYHTIPNSKECSSTQIDLVLLFQACLPFPFTFVAIFIYYNNRICSSLFICNKERMVLMIPAGKHKAMNQIY